MAGKGNRRSGVREAECAGGRLYTERPCPAPGRCTLVKESERECARCRGWLSLGCSGIGRSRPEKACRPRSSPKHTSSIGGYGGCIPFPRAGLGARGGLGVHAKARRKTRSARFASLYFIREYSCVPEQAASVPAL